MKTKTKLINKTLTVEFYGIDRWNRPVFYAESNKCFYGSLDKLFSTEATESEVLSIVNSDDLIFFGIEFDCEPNGDKPTYQLLIEKNDDIELICVLDHVSQRTGCGVCVDWCPKTKQMYFGGGYSHIPNQYSKTEPTIELINEIVESFKVGESK